jgi:hypothetical protein
MIGRSLVRRTRDFCAAHALTLSIAVALAIFLVTAIRFWHFWVRVIPAKLAALAKVILAFVRAHPHLSHSFHVFLNMVPDIAYLLLAFAGVSYLMPELVAKIEKRRPTRVAVMTLFALFGLLAILVNAINRADQEDKERESQGKLEKQGDKIDGLRIQQTGVLAFLANSKGQPNEAERRRQILETLRGRYVIDHPEVPVTMLTGDSWPPKEWMDKHLRGLGETFPFIPPAPLQFAESKPTLSPPVMDLDVYVGDDEAQRTLFTHDVAKPFRWEEIERACTAPFRCYPERDLKDKPIEIDVGTKGWARMFFCLFNIGGSSLTRPYISINLAQGHDVLLTRINQRQAFTASNRIGSVVEFKPGETFDIIPVNQSHTPVEFAVDIAIDPLVDKCLIAFKIYGDNMSVHDVIVPVHVTRNGS